MVHNALIPCHARVWGGEGREIADDNVQVKDGTQKDRRFSVGCFS